MCELVAEQPYRCRIRLSRICAIIFGSAGITAYSHPSIRDPSMRNIPFLRPYRLRLCRLRFVYAGKNYSDIIRVPVAVIIIYRKIRPGFRNGLACRYYKLFNIGIRRNFRPSSVIGQLLIQSYHIRYDERKIVCPAEVVVEIIGNAASRPVV